jgi:hypothetical protein
MEINYNTQATEDWEVIDQQQNESWATDIGSHHFDVMSNEAHPIQGYKTENFGDTATGLHPENEGTWVMASTNGTLLGTDSEWNKEMRRGIPDLPTNTPFFKCPFCERGKMVRKGGNKTTDEDNFIPGQAVSGPFNLDLQTGSNIKPSSIVKESRDGYIWFLTTINVSSRKLWTHSIKNKDPPTIAYIDKFLKRHGIRTTNPSKAIITTSETGCLAKSRSFEEIVSGQQYVIQSTNDDIDFFGCYFLWLTDFRGTKWAEYLIVSKTKID